MQRTIVNVARMRIIDLAVGDVINRDTEAASGWFEVAEIRRLPDGDLSVSGTATRDNVMGRENDIVGVQIPKVVEQNGG